MKVSFLAVPACALLVQCSSQSRSSNMAKEPEGVASIQTQETSSTRAPASITLQDPAELELLYADYSLKRSEIRQKIIAAKDSLQLLRSFIPVFYDIAEKSNPFPAIEKFRGKIAGDAHLENFGAVAKGDGTYLYTLNDFDDAGMSGPVYLDLIRLMTSFELSYFGKSDFEIKDKKNIVGEMYQSYLTGLSDKSIEAPSVISSLINIKHKDSWAPKRRFLDSKGENFTPPDEGLPLNTEEEEGFFLGIQQMLMKAKIISAAQNFQWSGRNGAVTAFKSKIYDGGSGGLERLTGAFRWKGAPAQLMIFEAKEMATAGSFPYDSEFLQINSDTNTLEVSEKVSARLQSFSQWARKSGNPYIGAIFFDQKIYAIRLRLQAENNLEFDDLKPTERKQVLSYQAYVLGKLHASSLEEKKIDYLKSLQSMKAGDFYDLALAFANKFDQLHERYQSFK